MNRSQVFTCFIFNGDADGLISQHLLKLSGVTPTLRITGLKREIMLLERLPPSLESANVYVFDISLEANRGALLPLLEKPGINLTWFDHHEAGVLPDSVRLKTHISNGRGICTALLVHGALPGCDPRWAAMAAFGDNIPEAGEALLLPLEVEMAEVAMLREAGKLLNYNAYGETVDDVLFHPAEVAERLASFRAPFEFIRESGIFEPLRRQFQEDETQAQKVLPRKEKGSARIYLLPDASWARRIGGAFANRISLENPTFAAAVLHPLIGGVYQVSIRAPRLQKAGEQGKAAQIPFASDLAREFPTGGGRALAAGINRLPASELPVFEKRFFDIYS
jgi:hypothetical protein